MKDSKADNVNKPGTQKTLEKNHFNHKVITGYQPEGPVLQNSVDLLLYDIPTLYSDQNLLEVFKSWGNVISFNRKVQ